MAMEKPKQRRVDQFMSDCGRAVMDRNPWSYRIPAKERSQAAGRVAKRFAGRTMKEAGLRAEVETAFEQELIAIREAANG